MADVGHIAHSTLGGYKSECGKCGARRIDNQIGLEGTPDAFVGNLVAVFAEVRRVLADDGTLWLNLGDSYVSVGGSGTQCGDGQMADRAVVKARAQVRDNKAVHDSILRPPSVGGLPQKNLVGIPWRVAFALQADGWYLRSDIIWSKPNPMPESVTDRPTKAHEYIFLLSKSPRYYYDADAIAEASSGLAGGRFGAGGSEVGRLRQDSARPRPTDTGERNKRSVWHVATQPYPEAHFATYPEKLIEPCILAGSRIGDTVLDPFTGSGTTGAVALRHQRNFIGCELNPAYVELARKRMAAVAPLFSVEGDEPSDGGEVQGAGFFDDAPFQTGATE